MGLQAVRCPFTYHITFHSNVFQYQVSKFTENMHRTVENSMSFSFVIFNIHKHLSDKKKPNKFGFSLLFFSLEEYIHTKIWCRYTEKQYVFLSKQWNN